MEKSETKKIGYDIHLDVEFITVIAQNLYNTVLYQIQSIENCLKMLSEPEPVKLPMHLHDVWKNNHNGLWGQIIHSRNRLKAIKNTALQLTLEIGLKTEGGVYTPQELELLNCTAILINKVAEIDPFMTDDDSSNVARETITEKKTDEHFDYKLNAFRRRVINKFDVPPFIVGETDE